MKFLLSLLLLATVLAGCSSTDTLRNPSADYSKIKRVYVERRLADDHGLDGLIVAQLRTQGLEASSGPLTMMPEHVDAIVTYSDDWAWDFKSYLNQLSIEIRNARTDEVIGRGVSRHASPVTKAPEKMVREILVKLFK